MSGLNSIGDLSRFVQMRQANSLLKSRLTVLSQEAASGLKADVPAATGGDMGRLAQVQTRLALIETYNRNASLAQSEMAGMQTALDTIGSIATARGPEFQSAVTIADDDSLNVKSLQAGQDFHAVVRMLNVDVGGRFILSGSVTTNPPLAAATEIMGLAKAQVAGLSDPQAIATALDDWFGSDAPGGFAAAAYRGNQDATTSGVSGETTVANHVTALDPAFRATLKGLAMAALANDPDLALSRVDKAQLISEAGMRMSGASNAVTSVQAKVGMSQQIVENAVARNSAERTALSIARGEILAADPYETASALTQTETSLQNLYALTARLSRLSLADYIR